MKTLPMAIVATLLLMVTPFASTAEKKLKPKKEPPPILYLMSVEMYPEAKIEQGFLILRASPEKPFGERRFGMGVEVQNGRFVEQDGKILLEVPRGEVHAKLGFFGMAGWVNPNTPRKNGDANTLPLWVLGELHRGEVEIPAPGEKGYEPIIVLARTEEDWKREREKAIAAMKTTQPSSASKKVKKK